jgi:hypothetical protein
MINKKGRERLNWRCYLAISREGLRKFIRAFRICDVPTKTWTGRFPNTSQAQLRFLPARCVIFCSLVPKQWQNLKTAVFMILGKLPKFPSDLHTTRPPTQWQLPEVVLTQYVSPDDGHDMLETCREL